MLTDPSPRSGGAAPSAATGGAPQPIPVMIKFDEDKYNEDKRKLILRMTLPVSWHTKPISKIIKHYVKKFNDSNPDGKLKADQLRLIIDREQSASPPRFDGRMRSFFILDAPQVSCRRRR